MPSPALVIGSGPNGLAAAIVLAQHGYAVEVCEAQSSPGGGARSAERTLPGFLHDLGSAVHPLAIASPFFSTLNLERQGLEWIQPVPLAHPLDDGTAVILERSVRQTANGLSNDRQAYQALMQPFADHWPELTQDILGPLRLPRHPVTTARFGWSAIRSARSLAMGSFRSPRARALLAGLAAHSSLTLDHRLSAGIALVLGTAAHATGWPIPRGGAQQITKALAAVLHSSGGAIRTSTPVQALPPPGTLTLADITPRQLLQLAPDRFPPGYRRKLERFRYGPAAYKVDWALAGPIPWRAAECLSAGTVHLGGTFEEISAAEQTVWDGGIAERPFVLLSQPSLFDPSRAPAGKHTVWAYCHVPNGSTVPMLDRIEAQVERFAPGFRELILARKVSDPASLEKMNANLVGGNISSGVPDLWNLLSQGYSTPLEGVYLCSASTPPGAGVHGMCGYHAARLALIR